ncbi:MAG: polyphosphate polymerase domain-containing protein [Lachnospiraceae bacterium]|nr:polyphosphate polymerase domain-containing protein [Lachnospiraceae bacterium]
MDMSAYREVFQRKEIKYLLDEPQYRELSEFLGSMARVDKYGLSRINNIYYDTPDHRLIRCSMEKPLYKEKLRLRTYGTADDDTNAFIEIKKKYAGVVYKRRISGKYKDMYGYLSGDKGDIGTSQIAKEIEAFRQLYGELIPAMSICYERIAMAGTEDKDFRITFDRNIEWNEECSDLRMIKKGKPLLQPGQYLMEIKVSNAFPRRLSQKLSELEVFPTSFSKYGAGYTDMMRENSVKVKKTSPAVLQAEHNNRKMKGEIAYV